AVVDQYLAPSGQVAFVLTQSLLKTGGAAEGFRTFNFPNHDLDAVHVDDFSKLRVFSGAATRPIVLVLGMPTDNSPNYFVWDADKATVAQDAPSTITQTLTHGQFIAEPVGEWGSAWLTGKPAAIDAVRKILGQSDYTAHAGVYTGGANAVYWLTVHERKNNLVRVSNIIKGAKRAVPQVDTWLEADLIYPLLRGRDVNRWQADPTVHILMLQNPETRQGYDADWLRKNYPRTYAYIQRFEDALRQRATLKRYFDEDVPFWTMFNIGTYTFAPYKVIWHGFGRSRMHAVVVGEKDGKAIMSNQAMHPFVGIQDEDEAHYIAACLNSAPFEFAVLSHTQPGGKSFAQPGILKSLRIPQYDATLRYHRDLARLSKEAHNSNVDDDAIAEASAQVWDLTASELAQLRQSLATIID
ncbi:MAG: SAM-dependent DNA methyltransferase, partial [Chloroflexota bacterium]